MRCLISITFFLLSLNNAEMSKHNNFVMYNLFLIKLKNCQNLALLNLIKK